MKLTEKQNRFCKEYLVDMNATQAAIRAGYSKKTANRIASENLSKPGIQKHLSQLINQQEKRTEINADSVINRLDQIANRCMQEVPVIVNGVKTGEHRFNPTGAIRALELLGKHYGLFTNRHEYIASDGSFIHYKDMTDEELEEIIKKGI